MVPVFCTGTGYRTAHDSANSANVMVPEKAGRQMGHNIEPLVLLLSIALVQWSVPMNQGRQQEEVGNERTR